jgi:uncharacterized membrane protein YfcA
MASFHLLKYSGLPILEAMIKSSPKLKLIGLITFLFLIWFVSILLLDKIHLFKENWPISLTMVFGSFIAGATSEGGGAIAFPVLTLFFKISPSVARDFSLMIQSFGMIVAAMAILFYRIPIVKEVIVKASLAGGLGLFAGLYFLNEKIGPSYLKMFFTSFWLSFCFVLWKKNHDSFGEYYDPQVLKNSSPLIIGVAFIGGIFSSLLGTGIDILLFSTFVLFFKINPKIATPTSVILMGINSAIGFMGRFIIPGPEVTPMVWDFLLVSIPVVIIGAPTGALFISKRSREFVERLLIASILIQFIASLIIINQTPQLIFLSVTTFSSGVLFFYLFSIRKKAS